MQNKDSLLIPPKEFYLPTTLSEKIRKIVRLYARILTQDLSPRLKTVPWRRSILMIVPELDRIGGYERQALELSRVLSASGEFVIILSNGGKQLPQRELRNGFLIKRLNSSVPFFVLLQLFWFLLSKRKHFDVVHIHGITGFSLVAARLALMLRLPVCIKPATADDLTGIQARRTLKSRLYSAWILRIKHWISISNQLTQEIRANAGKSITIHEFSNFVDTQKFQDPGPTRKQQIRDQLGVQNQMIFLYLGRLEQRKGLNVLLKAWSMSPCGLLRIVGSGPQESELKSFAESQSIPSVHFHGPTNWPLDYYHSADVFVLPSLKEGFPNVLLEAMSCGLPCIATSIGGVLDVFEDNRQGLLIPPGSTEKLSEALQRAATSAADRARWGLNARETALRYDCALIGQRYQELYSEMFQPPSVNFSSQQ